jgi:CRISPR-associated protein Cas1
MRARGFKNASTEITYKMGMGPIKDVMGIEGMIAHHYWAVISTIFDKKFEFDGRVYGKTIRPMGAVDPINALFNYGYSILESQCWKALNSVGLDPHVGFLHEMNPSKAPLVYDFQEPFRWIVDVTVLSALEKEIFTKKDFIRTENYNIRIRPDGVKKLMAELIPQFSKTVKYSGYHREWGYIITEKAYELGQFIIGKRKALDFSEPEPVLERHDSDDMRKKILDMSYTEWERMGFSKGTLNYLKRNAKDDKPFKIYGKVRDKLDG